jgi:hypothetical protein
MRTIQNVRAGWLIGALGACMLTAGLARADVTTERPGSILIFPKVVNAGTRDTVIQITNTGNNLEELHCFYTTSNSDSRSPLCRTIDFFLTLTKQQPTHWDAGVGRTFDSDSGGGIDPGIIPPVGAGFAGALVCVEVGDDDVPIAMNKLKGEATLENTTNGDVSKYSGITIQGATAAGANTGGSDLELDNAEYNACPTASVFNFVIEGSPDPAIEGSGNAGLCTGGTNVGEGCNPATELTDCPGTGGGVCTSGLSSVQNVLTLLPCNLDFRDGLAAAFKLSYVITYEDEVQFSFSDSVPFACVATVDLASIPNTGVTTHGPFASIRITAASGGPVIGVGETFHIDSTGASASSANNLHTIGLCSNTVAPARSCTSDADCAGISGGSTCTLTDAATIKLPQP